MDNQNLAFAADIQATAYDFTKSDFAKEMFFY